VHTNSVKIVSERQISVKFPYLIKNPDLFIFIPHSTKIMSKPPPSDEEDAEDAASIVNSSDDDAPSSSVARAYIQPEEECPKLLRFIYECPMICKITEHKKLKKSQNKFWICKWCPTTINGPRKFKGHNATKALSHVCGIPGETSRNTRVLFILLG